MECSIPCCVAETWRKVQMKWPRVKGDRAEQHRESRKHQDKPEDETKLRMKIS